METAWTHAKTEQVQTELDQFLGPELVSKRPGFNGNGDLLFYLTINQARALANDIFGHAEWQATVQWDSIDQITENEMQIEAVVTCCVRVTLSNGTHREDIGCSRAQDPQKDEAIRKARSIARSDGTKRALKQFGYVLGSCLADQDYTSYLATTLTSSQSQY